MNCKSIREAIDVATRRSGYNETVCAHLSGCSDCRRHADEMSSLFALLSAQPRVEAPAGFEFRLRARMARAKSEPVTASGRLEKLWSKSFTFGQAATAMAAIAVAVTASTFYFTHHNEVAGNSIADNSVQAISPVAGQTTPVTPVELPESTAPPAIKTVSVKTASGTNRTQKPA